MVVIDPGHNGANGANPGIINAWWTPDSARPNPATPPAPTTNAGYPEHAFTWGVANDLRPMLEAKASR